MFDLPSCFGDYGVQVTNPLACGASRVTENMVTCLYRIKMAGMLPLVTITWCKSLVGLGLSLNMQDPAFCESASRSARLDTKPWLFSKKKGSKILEVARNLSIHAVWDLANAMYASGPEPINGFFFALVYDHEILLLLGDMTEDVYTKIHARSVSSDAIMISRREHIFGRRAYSTKAQFGENGPTHDILIECNTRAKDPRLCVRVDKQIVLQVKRLLWKFRGNQTILVDGYAIELFWDVHNWLFSPIDGNAVFMFQTTTVMDNKSWSSLGSSSSFQLHNSPSSSMSLKGSENSGFSLLLYAWRSD